MSAPPKWATDLTVRVCTENDIAVPALVWYRSRVRWHGSRPVGSSGRYFHETHRIHVTAGSYRVDQKLVLLHELAHAAHPREHHSPAFWVTAFTFFRTYGVPMLHAKRHSFSYRRGARAGYAAAKAQWRTPPR